jgi:hypothetical protein
MSIPLDSLSPRAAATWTRLRDELSDLLGNNLLALWAYGARTFPNPPKSLGDHDTFAVLERIPDESTILQIGTAQKEIEKDLDVSLDTSFVLRTDAVRPEPPSPAWGEGKEVNWPFHRAHFLAGSYVLLHGVRPEDLVPEPTWAELEHAMEVELDHLERHVAAGDDDPYESSYALLNGSRIFYSIQERNVVISKRDAGSWALDHLPPKWHAPIHAAGRAYDGESTDEDAKVLREAMVPFVKMLRRMWHDHRRRAGSGGASPHH